MGSVLPGIERKVMKVYQNEVFEAERALYGSRDTEVVSCRFDGPADGEAL